MPETSPPDNSRRQNKDITENSADFEFEPLPIVPEKTTTIDYGRRIKRLMAGIIIAGLAYTGAWFWAGNKLVTLTNTAIDNTALKGQIIICNDTKAQGYPFRMGLACSKTGFSDTANGLKLEAGAFRSAAQVYQPRRVITELDGPLSLSTNTIQPLTINWALARTSINGLGGLPQRVSIVVEKPVMAETNAPSIAIGAANLAAFHMRQGDNNQIDLAVNIDDTVLKNAPVFNLSADAAISGATRFEAALKSKTRLIEVLRGNDGQLRNIKLAFADGGNVAVSGPFSLSSTGLLSAQLSFKADKAAALIDNLAKLSIAFGVTPPNLAAIKAMAVVDQISLTITIKDGNASIGFIPLGKIPPL